MTTCAPSPSGVIVAVARTGTLLVPSKEPTNGWPRLASIRVTWAVVVWKASSRRVFWTLARTSLGDAESVRSKSRKIDGTGAVPGTGYSDGSGDDVSTDERSSEALLRSPDASLRLESADEE